MLVRALLPVLLAACAAANPIIGVPHVSALAPEEQDEQDTGNLRRGVLVVTTSGAPPTERAPESDDVVPLDSPKERSRFLVTLLMLESLRNKPGSAAEAGVTGKLKAQLLADEELMQEVLQLYEAQQETKRKPFIKIPPKLLKKIRRKMKELMSE